MKTKPKCLHSDSFLEATAFKAENDNWYKMYSTIW